MRVDQCKAGAQRATKLPIAQIARELGSHSLITKRRTYLQLAVACRMPCRPALQNSIPYKESCKATALGQLALILPKPRFRLAPPLLLCKHPRRPLANHNRLYPTPKQHRTQNPVAACTRRPASPPTPDTTLQHLARPYHRLSHSSASTALLRPGAPLVFSSACLADAWLLSAAARLLPLACLRLPLHLSPRCPRPRLPAQPYCTAVLPGHCMHLRLVRLHTDSSLVVVEQLQRL